MHRLSLCLLVSLLTACIVHAAPPTVGQYEIRKRTSTGFESYGVTITNGQAFGLAAGIPAAVTVGGGSGTGTVTSVALTLPGIFSVTGSPITESGTLAASLATQTANRVWAGPTTGSAAAPTFRALVAADIPDLSGTYQPFSSALTTYSGIAPSSNVQSFLGAANYAAMRGLLSLGNVENTALSTWTGSTSIVTLGTISIGTWQGNSIDEAYISSAAIWNAKESALTFSTGLTRTTNTITVNATQNISRLSNLTTNGFLKASGSNGTLSIDTSTYVTSDDAAATYQPLIGTGTLALSKLATDPLARANHTGTQAWSTITSTPTTLAGYGIVDSITAALAASTYQPLTSNLTTYSGITPSANVQTLLGAANYAAFKASLSLGNVENTALSTWAGSTNVTTLGTISAGTWNGSIIAPAYLGTGSSISAKFLRGDGTWQTVSATGGTWGTISGTLADQTDLQTALNSKLDASGGSAVGLASFSILNSGTGALYFQINHVGTLSASRTLTFNLNDSDRVLSLSGNLTISADATVSGTNTGDQTNITGTAGGLSSTLAVTSGGTGQTSYTDGQLLIGNTTGNTLAKATLTAGSGISITNGHGTITIASTSSGGTVTSVAASVPAFLSVSGSPITSSGTLAITLSGTALPVANGGTGITAFGTGIATALGVNIGSAGAPVLFNGDAGTPSAIVLTNATGTAAGLSVGAATSATSATSASGLNTSGSPVSVAAAAPPSTGQVLTATSSTAATWQSIKDFYPAACSNETDALTTGLKLTFRIPYACTLSAVRLDVSTAPTGSVLIVDVKESGTTIFSTKPQIAVGAKTSVGGAVPGVLSDASLAENAEITVFIDQIGSTIAGAGLKITLVLTR